MRPPEQDLETLMQQRYGVSPGVVVPPDETTPGDLEAEEDNLDESGVVFMPAPGVQRLQLETRIFRSAANALSEKFRDVEVSFSVAHSGPTGEIPLRLGMDLPATAEPYPVGRFGSLSGPFFRSGIPPSSTSRDRPGEFHFPRPPDNTPIHVTKDSVEILKAFFLSAGVDLSPPNQIDPDEAKEELRIQATPGEIGIIQKALEVLGLPEFR